MKEANLIRAIKYALSPFNERGEDLFILPPMANKREEYKYALFFNEKNLRDYVDGCDSEDIVIWQIPTGDNKGKFGFSYNVHDPGVRYHKDGSGTPPSDELVEHKEIYATIQMCVEGIAKHMMNQRISEMKEALSFVYSHFPEED